MVTSVGQTLRLPSGCEGLGRLHDTWSSRRRSALQEAVQHAGRDKIPGGDGSSPHGTSSVGEDVIAVGGRHRRVGLGHVIFLCGVFQRAGAESNDPSPTSLVSCVIVCVCRRLVSNVAFVSCANAVHASHASPFPAVGASVCFAICGPPVVPRQLT